MTKGYDNDGDHDGAHKDDEAKSKKKGKKGKKSKSNPFKSALAASKK